MSGILKSKLIRSELKHWITIAALTLWGLIATAYAVSKKDRILVVGLDDAGARLITTQSDRLLKSELQKFLFHFIDLYYAYDEKTFLNRAGRAADLFSEALWNQEKSKLFELSTKLQKTPLSQSYKIESIDLIENGKVEALLEVAVKTRISEQKVKLKVLISYKSTERTEPNPYAYVITEVSDVRL